MMIYHLFFRFLSLVGVTVMVFSTPIANASEAWDGLKEQLYPGQAILDGTDLMTLQAPKRALDAALVPISIDFSKKQGDGVTIKQVTLIVDENPSPVAAVMDLTPSSGLASITTRIRIDKYTHVRAIAQTDDGQTYMVSRFVKAAGGCSAPVLSDMDMAMKRIGRMRMKFLEPSTSEIAVIGADAIGKAHLLISHPNFSGLQFNQISRTEIPAHYVDGIRVLYDDKQIIHLQTGITLSENPSLHFFYRKGEKDGILTVEATDSEGGNFTKSWPTAPAKAQINNNQAPAS